MIKGEKMKDMLKRILKVLALFSVSVLCFCYACSCGKTDEGLKNFNLSAGSATIIEGEKFVITTDLSEDVAIIWESDDEAVATVENGTVSGVATGEATITATAGNTVKKCYVTVIKETRRAVLTIANAEDGGILKLGVNYKYTLNPKVYFDGKDVTEESTFEYRAEDGAILSVDGNGEITTKELGGETTITVIAKYREKTYETLCAELKCIVVADEWNVFTDTDEPLYALAEYDGVTYKNTAAYSAELILSGKSADASLIRCKATDENADSEAKSGLSGLFSKVTEGVSSAAAAAVDKLKHVLNDFLEALAVMLVTSCLIPVLVLVFFVWLLKLFLGVDAPAPRLRAHAKPQVPDERQEP